MKWREFEKEYNKYPLSKTSTWYHREIIGRLTKPVVFIALKLGLSANMTTFAAFMCIFAAMCVILVYPRSLWLGLINLILLQLGFTLDCADGAVARIRQQTSSFGHFFDIFIDLLNHLSVFIGFGLYYYFFDRSFDPKGILCIIFGSTIYYTYYLSSEFRGLIFLDLKGTMSTYGSNLKEKIFKFPYQFISRPVFYLFLSLAYISDNLVTVFFLYGLLSLLLVVSMLFLLYRRYNKA